MIPYGKQEVTEEDIAAVVEVLRSDFLTQGPRVPEFERNVAEYCSARFCGADINFVDIDAKTYNMSVSCLEEKLKTAAKVGKSPKVVIPVHTQPYYKKLGFHSGDFQQAESYYVNALSLPMYHHLKTSEQDYVASCLESALSESIVSSS